MPRHLIALTLGSLGATTLLLGPPPAVAQGPAADAAQSYLANPSFVTNAAGWRAGSHDKIVRHRYADGTTAGHLTSISSAGRGKYLSVTSSAGPAVPAAGSAVEVSARVRTSAAPRSVVLRVEEVVGDRVVQRSQTTTRTRSTAWFTASRATRTQAAGSRLRVYVGVGSISGRQYLRLRDVAVQVTPPAASTCEAIDYSDPAQGVKTLDEEFDGTRLDPSMWRVRDNTFLNQDAAFIDRDNVSVHDGYLDITGRREPESAWRSNAKSLYGAENRVRRYSTGYVDSIKSKTYESPDPASAQRFSQQYGHFEARMWVPSAATMSRGVWPAFWLRGDRTNGEIDVMESYGAPSIRSFDPSPSYEWNSWHDTAQQLSKAHFLGRPKVAAPIWQGWHTYGVNWSPTCLRYTLDGRTVGTARPIDGEVPYLNGATFDSPFHLRFNMQVGSKYWGWPDPSTTRDEFHFKVDWVRVHQSR